jgi:hypothetical protein
MARESKTEIEVRDAIARHLLPNETLREFSRGTTEGSISAAYFLLGALGAALTGRNEPGYFIGLTDRRLILLEVKGNTPTGEVLGISISDIKGLQYRSSGTTGNLNVHLSHDTLQLVFDKRPWWPRAKNMAQIMPLQK